MANNNQFNLEVGVQLSTADLVKQLEGFTKKNTQRITVKVDGKEAIKQTETYVNSLGKTIKTVQTLSKDGVLGKTTVKSIKETTASLIEGGKSINTWTDSMGKLRTVINEVDELGNKTHVHIKEWVDSAGEYHNQIDKFSQSNQRLSMTIDEENEYLAQTSSAFKQVQVDSAKLNEEADRLNKTLKENQSLFSQFKENLSKVIRFGISATIFGGLTQAIRGSGEVLKEFDTALTDFKKVSDLSGESLQRYTEQLGELGAQVGRTRKFLCACV